MSELPYRARAFGQNWISDIALGHFDEITGGSTSTHFSVRRIAELRQRNIIAHRGRGEICDDGFRFGWANVATFDVHDTQRIGYLPHDDWRGTLPVAFFSTVAALATAGIGMLPMHASAVEVNGRAYLFAGSAGAGKSTLTAELIANGARFLGDDLTVLRPPDDVNGFRVTRGRPAMRLHPATAALIEADCREHVPDDMRGKMLVRPRARADDIDYPLAGVFLIGPGSADVKPSEALRQLPMHLFRPRWMNAMSGRGQRQAWLIDMAGRVPVWRMPTIDGFDARASFARAQAVLNALAR